MTTETIETTFENFDNASISERIEAIIRANQRALAALDVALPALDRAAAGIRDKLTAGGRLVYIGAGTSGRLALQDAAELPPTFGFDRTVVLLAGGLDAGKQAKEGAEDDVDAAREAVRNARIGARDAVIGVAASGKTPFTVAGLREARAQGAFTIGIANNPDTPVLSAADVAVLLDTGPEVIAGSTRMAAGTAQKVALNILSTVPMPELGAVYKNLMVGMKPSNDKLYARAVQMVVTATGATTESAQHALAEVDWDIRQAIVMLETNLPAREAQELLARHQNRIRVAIAAFRKRE